MGLKSIRHFTSPVGEGRGEAIRAGPFACTILTFNWYYKTKQEQQHTGGNLRELYPPLKKEPVGKDGYLNNISCFFYNMLAEAGKN
jgi:hypothetical protein